MNKLDVTYHKGLDPQDVVEHFICAFNDKRLEVLNRLWSSPCTFIIKDQIKSYQKYSQAVNFSEIEREGWKYTKIDSLSKEYSSNKTAIIEFSFSRYNAHDETLSKHTVKHILIKIKDLWRINTLLVIDDNDMGGIASK